MEPREFRTHGLYFEELNIGDRMFSQSRTVTEADVVAFCGLSGDFHGAHSDVEYAKSTLFGQRVAHGMLGLSIASGLASHMPVMQDTAQAFMGVDWRFKRPIFIGDTIRVHATITRKREAKALGGGYLFLRVEVLNQRDQVVQEGQWTTLMKSRPATA